MDFHGLFAQQTLQPPSLLLEGSRLREQHHRLINSHRPTCPECQGRRKDIAFIEDEEVIEGCPDTLYPGTGETLQRVLKKLGQPPLTTSAPSLITRQIPISAERAVDHISLPKARVKNLK